jgi:hypothetical protein
MQTEDVASLIPPDHARIRCAVPFSVWGEAPVILQLVIDTDVHYEEGPMVTRTKSTRVTKSTKSTKARAAQAQVKAAPGAPLDITTRDTEGRTPLHLAAFFGYFDTVRRMLLQQADVNARDNHQRTPGHWSAFKGHLEVIKMLTDSGADLNARDTEGRTLLRMAGIGRQSIIEEFLRMHGAVL